MAPAALEGVGMAVEELALGTVGFFCPCHNSLFSVEGKRSEDSPSPRDLDTLDVELRKNNEVWVKFKNFRTGQAEKVADT